MFVKKLIIVTILILTQSCGFSPMYSKGNLDSNFFIVELKFDGDGLINNYLENGLTKFNNIDANKKYKIEIFTDYKKNILTKDLTGTATDYQLVLNTTVNINQNFLDKEKNYTVKFTDRFNIKKFDDTFEEDNYERTIKKNFSETLISKIILNLSSN